MLLPVIGNLFHHAIELYIKGYLSIKLTENELLSYKHNLKELWKVFKQEVNELELDNFNELIATVHKFEDIRYPDKIHREGAMIFVDIGKGKSYMLPRRPEAEYRINVWQIDALVKILFAKASFNPPFFFTPALGNKDASKYLKKLNKEKVWR